MDIIESKILQAKAEGKTKEQIFSILIAEGFSVDSIVSYFNKIESPNVSSSINDNSPSVNNNSDMEGSTMSSSEMKVEESEGEEDHRGKATKTLVTGGAILIAAGVFSFIASNWQEMVDITKVLIILLGIIVFNVLGFYLHEKTALKNTGEAMILLGSLVFGAGIFLVAQIYNIRAEWPDGFAMWALGVLPFFFIYKSKALFVLFMIVSIIGANGYPFVGLWDFDLNNTRHFVVNNDISTIILYVTTIVILYAGFFLLKRNPVINRKYY